jgi:hypothetical protein
VFLLLLLLLKLQQQLILDGRPFRALREATQVGKGTEKGGRVWFDAYHRHKPICTWAPHSMQRSNDIPPAARRRGSPRIQRPAHKNVDSVRRRFWLLYPSSRSNATRRGTERSSVGITRVEQG